MQPTISCWHPNDKTIEKEVFCKKNFDSTTIHLKVIKDLNFPSNDQLLAMTLRHLTQRNFGVDFCVQGDETFPMIYNLLRLGGTDTKP